MGREYQRTIISHVTREYPPDLAYFSDGGDHAQWAGSGTGTDWNVASDGTVFICDTIKPLSQTALRIRTKATAPAIGDQVKAKMTVGKRNNTLVRGSTIWIWSAGSGDEPTQRMEMEVFDITKDTKFGAQFDGATAEWQYLNSTGTYVNLPGAPNEGPASMWMFIEMEVDNNAQEYKSITIGGEKINMTGTSGKIEAASGFSHIEISFTGINTSADQNTMHMAQIAIHN